MWPFDRKRRTEQVRDARRYRRLLSEIDDLHKWCDGETRVAAQWLLQGDRNHWRALDEQPVRDLPAGISDFREHIKRLRGKP